MSTEVAQVTATPGSGASNSSDFQPTTRNPQTAPVNLFQQQSGLQNVTNTQELLSDNQNVRISITAEPAPAQPAVAAANETPVGFIALAVLIIIGAGALILFRKFKNKPGTVSEEPQAPKPIVSSDAPAETLAKKTKKTAAKKRTSKKSKRKRR